MATVLVIDDDQMVRRVLTQVLTMASYRTVEAANGREGLAVFRAQRPEVVVTDIMMPEQEGIETIRLIRREAPETPIVAMSGGGSSRDLLFLKMSKDLGADMTLAKPFRPDELIEAVDMVRRSVAARR
jgi:DNA-binding response OmpR family regulator